jgi:hypothetical protein
LATSSSLLLGFVRLRAAAAGSCTAKLWLKAIARGSRARRSDRIYCWAAERRIVLVVALTRQLLVLAQLFVLPQP